jgi:hypothetical protein
VFVLVTSSYKEIHTSQDSNLNASTIFQILFLKRATRPLRQPNGPFISALETTDFFAFLCVAYASSFSSTDHPLCGPLKYLTGFAFATNAIVYTPVDKNVMAYQPCGSTCIRYQLINLGPLIPVVQFVS